MLEILQLVGTCVFGLKHWIKGQSAVAIGSIRSLAWALCTLWLSLKVGKDGYLLLRPGKGDLRERKGAVLWCSSPYLSLEKLDISSGADFSWCCGHFFLVALRVAFKVRYVFHCYVR